jgi:Holliday junction resolvase RusA-like endonuclease
MRTSLTIPGEPVAKERPRRGAHGNFYTPRSTQAYEEIVGMYALQLPRYEGPVSLNLIFFCSPRPWQKMPDLDNLIKSILDGLQKGRAIVDDVQVAELNACRMIETKHPRVELRIVALEH